MDVILLYHIAHAKRNGFTTHSDENGEPLLDEELGDDVKLLGCYSSVVKAEDRIQRARTQPGFRDEPDCFQVVPHMLDKDEWVEGFDVISY